MAMCLGRKREDSGHVSREDGRHVSREDGGHVSREDEGQWWPCVQGG